uniref:BED-type domain-containing protein n=1 Tax=Parascaris univalens TaxID=6257 RepID=A0A915AS30_PARUN
MTTSSPSTPAILSSNSSTPSPATQSHLVQSMSSPAFPTQHGLISNDTSSQVVSNGAALGSGILPPSVCSLMTPKIEDCLLSNSAMRTGQQNVTHPAATMPGDGPMPSPLPHDVLAQVITPPAGMTTVNGLHHGSGDLRRSRRPFKPSTVWDHFLKLSDGNVQCVHCAKILKRKDSSTKTMWGHLRAIHFKGRDWTALQQQAQAANNPASDPYANMDDSLLTDTSIGSTQSWLEEQLGISSSPSHDENQVDTRGDSCNIEFSDLEPQEGGGVKRHSDMSATTDSGTSTQSDVKRNRPTGYSPGAHYVNDVYVNTVKPGATNGLTAVRAALSQQQKNADDKKTMNFLAMIPRSSEVINITAGFSGEEDGAANSTECNSTIEENGEECSSEGTSRSAGVAASGSAPAPGRVNNQLSTAALLSAASNDPFMYMAAANAVAASGMNCGDKMASTFSLMDGDCVVTLMRVAAELGCTFLFHCRDGQSHFCFEANDIAAERLRGPELSLVDIGNEVRVTEWNAGVELESEMWKKTDWAQFTWAIRGKCQKVLLKR